MRVLLAADALTSAYYNSATPHDIPRIASLNVSSIHHQASPAASAPQTASATTAASPATLSSSSTTSYTADTQAATPVNNSVIASALSTSVLPTNNAGQQEQAAALTSSIVASPLDANSLVEFHLVAEDASNAPITNLTAGEDFQLVMFVKDLRPDTSTPTTAGVFSAYANVSYDTSIVAPASGATITYGSFFGIVQSGSLATAGQIIDAGASGSSLTPPGSAEQMLWKVPFHVNASAGSVTFTPSFNNVAGHDTTLYLLNTAVPAAQIQYDTLNLPLGSVPTVSSIAKTDSDPTSAATLHYTVTFSESVTGVDATDFSLVPGAGVTGASITNVSGTGAVYTVTVDRGIGTGTLGLNLVDDDSIKNTANTPLGGAGTGNGNFTGAFYTITNAAPTVASILPTDTNPTNLATVHYAVVFSQSVTGVDTTDFSLVPSAGVTGASITSVTGSGTTYTVTVNRGTGDGTLGLNLVDDDSIKNSDNTPLGGAGTGNGNFTGTPVYTIVTPPKVSVSNVTQPDGNSGFPPVVFTVSLSSASTQQVLVPFSTTDGTASSVPGPNQDYVATSGTVTFAPNQTVALVTVLSVGDPNFDTDETFSLVLGTPTNATLDPAQSVGLATLQNVNFPVFSVNNVSQLEGNSGQTPFEFTVTLPGPIATPATLEFQTQDGTAGTADNDYVATSGTLTFAINTTAQVITVMVNGNTTPEPNEDFHLVLTNPTNATFGSGTGIATGTILNDDGPRISFVNNHVSQAEGNSGQTPFVFTVSIATAPTSGTVSVAYTTQDGADPNHSATASSDYTAVSGTLTFSPGDPITQTITVEVNGDLLNEADEDFNVVLSNATNASLLETTATGTILNDDPAPLLSIVAPAPITQGTTGSQPDVFTVNLSAPSGQAITVAYAARNGDNPDAAESGIDFQDVTATLTFAPGTTQQLITVNILGETINEANENFKVQLFNSVNAGNAGTGQDLVTAIATINNVNPLPTLSISDLAPQNQGAAGTTTNFVFTVSITPVSGRTITVAYNTSDGTATTADNDYVATSGTLTFNPDVQTQLITVVVNGDNTAEADETFHVNLGAAQNVVLGQTVATATILNAGATGISIGNVSQPEGNSGTTPFLFTVSLSNPSNQAVTVNYTTMDGSATTANLDYVSQTGTLTFAPNTTSQVITVLVNGNTVFEPDENFSVVLSNPTGATIGTATAIGTIQNDDSAPSISIGDVSQLEGTSGQTPFVFTVSLSSLTGQAVTVSYATADGTATTANNDYVATSGMLTFAPGGATTQTITVNVIGDLVNKPNENFFVNLSNPSNATFSKQQATGTIQSQTVITPSTLSGSVFLDLNGNGVQDGNEKALTGTVVTLKGTADGNVAVNRTTTVASDGTYQFTGVNPGSYSVIYNESADFLPGKVQVGSQGGTIAGTSTQPAMLVVITDPGGITGTSNNLLVPGAKPEAVSQRQFLASSRLSTNTVSTAAALASPASPNANSLLATTASGSDLITQNGDTVTVHGTAGDDTFQFVAGAMNTVSINGVTRQFSSASVKNFVFDGGGGNDTATLTGSSGDDVASLGIGSGTLTGANYSVSVNNVTSLSVNGGGGHDVATLQDSAFNDHLEALGDTATISNDLGFATSVAAFAQVNAKSSNGGTDTAHVGAVDFALAQEGAWMPN